MVAPVVASDPQTGIRGDQAAELIATQPPEVLRQLIALLVALGSVHKPSEASNPNKLLPERV